MKRSQRIPMTTYRAGLLQSQAYRSLKLFMDGFLKPHNLMTPEWALLGVVFENHSIPASALARELGTAAPRVTKMLDHLEAQGYVVRRDDLSDTRVRCVELTPRGHELVDQLERELRTEMKRFMKGVNLPELAIYLNVLGKIVRAGENWEK